MSDYLFKSPREQDEYTEACDLYKYEKEQREKREKREQKK